MVSYAFQLDTAPEVICYSMISSSTMGDRTHVPCLDMQTMDDKISMAQTDCGLHQTFNFK